MRTVLIQGASTAVGWYDMEGSGWVSRLSSEILPLNQVNPKEAILVQNDAVPGNTLPAVLRDMSRVDKFQRLGKVTTVLAIGLNESKIMSGQTRPLVSLSRFKEALNMYGEYVSARDVNTVYLGTELLTEQTIVTDNGNIFEDDLTDEYDDLIKNHAESLGMPYIHTKGLLRQAGGSEAVCGDGFHPNHIGHAVISSAIKDVIKNFDDFIFSEEPSGLYPHSA